MVLTIFNKESRVKPLAPPLRVPSFMMLPTASMRCSSLARLLLDSTCAV